MGNDVGKSIWDSHPVIKADAAKATKANARALKAANAPSKYKAPTANVRERKAVQNVASKIQANYPNKPRKDAFGTAASIVQKEGPSVSKEAGKGPGSAQRFQQSSTAVPTRTSGLSGVSGKLGGQHAGGHGASLGGMSGMDLGGGGSFSRENM